MTPVPAIPLRRMYVTFPLPEQVASVLSDAFDVTFAIAGTNLQDDQVIAGLSGFDMLLTTVSDHLDAALIDRLPDSIRAIGNYSVGYNHIDIAHAKAKGIAVFNTPEVLSDAVAEIGLLLMLGAARRATESIALVRSGDWQGWKPTQLNGVGLAGKRLGVFGMGRIGQAIAHRARAFGMSIHYANRSRLPADLEGDASYHQTPEDMLQVCDFLMLACPATPQTVGFLNAERIALLPPGAIVANVGRGTVVVDADLTAALASGRVGAAGLDVFDGEPAIHPDYLRLPNVFMLPHIGSSTIETRREMAQILVDGLRALERGEDASNRIA